MPYKNKADRMKRQQVRRDTPGDLIDTPMSESADTPVRLDTPIDTPVCLTGLARLISTSQGKSKLDHILEAFESSSHPEYMQDVRLGYYGPTLWAINRL